MCADGMRHHAGFLQMLEHLGNVQALLLEGIAVHAHGRLDGVCKWLITEKSSNAPCMYAGP